MKLYDIYIEHYIDENYYDVYIHHGEGTDELVHPIEIKENLSGIEARKITNDFLARYSLEGRVRINIEVYEEVVNLKDIRILTAEEFNHFFNNS
ncbi:MULTISPECIES: hypothetical protein [Pontibacillus]|uniref:Uncharacterized protein n=1 Tax=Pontibacillus chungwhensis TaxID=265426 RepID=A0ABY8UVU7_9BACI|nr:MULTISPECIES: hypothetical protein [Pontibacillus]MCD5324142.1 hypothetical protein [Pontibacillus sp. HN14]WIF97800.1 hypothetical protein QNI29_19065 [Pontibacillus chungwhensis]